MAFIRYKTSPGNMVKMLSVASTTITVGDALSFTSGTVTNATTTGVQIYGIAMEAKASSDATTTAILVDVIRGPEEEFLCTNATGTMTAAKIGTRCDLVNATPGAVAIATTTNKDVTLVGWDGATATKAIVVFNQIVGHPISTT